MESFSQTQATIIFEVCWSQHGGDCAEYEGGINPRQCHAAVESGVDRGLPLLCSEQERPFKGCQTGADI